MKALKGRMPRTMPDHRSALAKRLRAVYDDLAGRFPLADGVSRRVAVMTARAWLEYEAVSAETAALAARNGRGRGKAAAFLTRLRRRQAAYAGQFLGGLRLLASFTDSNGHQGGLDLAAELAQQGMGL